jgi:hypothetical protein
MKYAISREMMKNRFPSWTVEPWKLMGLVVYDTIAQVPDDAILIASHYAPWWSPLKEWIAEGRPWIEIDYAYWGDKNTARRITYNGYHNIHINSHPFSRSHLFPTPQVQDWRSSSTDEYVLGILPIESLLLQRTGEDLEKFKIRLSEQISQYWDGPVKWRKKVGKSMFYTLQQDIKNAYAVVGERTMACVQSCLLGTPAFTIDNSMTTLLMGGIENLKTVSYPDRQNWWEHICWSQFHVKEFTTKTPAELTEYYQLGNCT